MLRRKDNTKNEIWMCAKESNLTGDEDPYLHDRVKGTYINYECGIYSDGCLLSIFVVKSWNFLGHGSV
jgi:hypothetical protein